MDQVSLLGGADAETHAHPREPVIGGADRLSERSVVINFDRDVASASLGLLTTARMRPQRSLAPSRHAPEGTPCADTSIVDSMARSPPQVTSWNVTGRGLRPSSATTI